MVMCTERIQWACDMAAKQRKMITSRPRVKPVSSLYDGIRCVGMCVFCRGLWFERRG